MFVEACWVCKGSAKEVSSVGHYRILRCETCGLTWVPRADLKAVGVAADYQDYGYNRNLTRHFELMRAQYQRGLRQRLERSALLSLAQKSFLDVGCANGEYLRTALDIGFSDASGIEIDEAARIRALVHGRVVTDASDLTGQKFDVIQIKNVLSNIEDPNSFLRAILALLKEDGVLIVDVLNQDSLTADLRGVVARMRGARGRFGPLRPPYVINGFTRRSLRLLLESHGLTLLHLSTSYMGSDMVPYGPSLLAKILGRAGSLIGKGSMLLSEAKRG